MVNFPESKENPEPTIMIPPAILSASMPISKNFSTYCTMKKEIIRIIYTFIPVHNEKRERSFFVSEWVSPTKKLAGFQLDLILKIDQQINRKIDQYGFVLRLKNSDFIFFQGLEFINST